MRLIILFIIVSQVCLSSILQAQTPDSLKATSQTPKFELREPRLTKKNATDWLKTTGIISGTAITGGLVYWLATRSAEDGKREETDLPLPPNWPGSTSARRPGIPFFPPLK